MQRVFITAVTAPERQCVTSEMWGLVLRCSCRKRRRLKRGVLESPTCTAAASEGDSASSLLTCVIVCTTTISLLRVYMDKPVSAEVLYSHPYALDAPVRQR